MLTYRHYFPRTALPGLALLLTLSLPAFAENPPPALTFNVDHFTLSDPLPIEQEQVDQILAAYTGRQIGINELREAAKSLEQHVRDRGWAFYRIVLPPQTLSDGEIRLQVIDFRVGNISVENNQHFDETNIRAMLPTLEEGASPNVHRLGEGVRYANRHPSKRIELVFRDGKAEQTVDANLRVRDGRAWTGFGILRNTGSEATGDWRFSFGGQHTNLFNRDHTLNITATTSPEAHHHDDVKQVGISYGIPFYEWGGYAQIFFAKSDVDSGIIENFFEVSGAGKSSGFSLAKYLPRIGGNYDHEIGLSLEDKHFDVDVRSAVGGLISFPRLGDVRSRPLGLQYMGTRENAARRLRFQIQYVANLPGGSDNSDAAYEQARFAALAPPFRSSVGASNNWTLWRLGAQANWIFPNQWRCNLEMRGQWTDHPLIPGEQFGIGGFASVRGYEEREIAGDSGFVVRSEAVAPAILDRLETLAFLDYGYRHLDAPQGILEGHSSLYSAGLGIRYSLGPIALHLDFAHALKDATQTENSDLTAHVALMMKF